MEEVVRWYKECFPAIIVDPKRVMERFAEIRVKCDVARAVREEFGISLTEGHVERGFWWDGVVDGYELSCYVVVGWLWGKAYCRLPSGEVATLHVVAHDDRWVLEWEKSAVLIRYDPPRGVLNQNYG